MLSIQGIDTSDKFGFLDKYDRDTTILNSMMYDGILKAVGGKCYNIKRILI